MRCVVSKYFDAMNSLYLPDSRSFLALPLQPTTTLHLHLSWELRIIPGDFNPRLRPLPVSYGKLTFTSYFSSNSTRPVVCFYQYITILSSQIDHESSLLQCGDSWFGTGRVGLKSRSQNGTENVSKMFFNIFSSSGTVHDSSQILHDHQSGQ